MDAPGTASGRRYALIPMLIISTLIVWAVLVFAFGVESAAQSGDVIFVGVFNLILSALIVFGMAALITRHWELGALLLTPVVLVVLIALSLVFVRVAGSDHLPSA